MNDTIFISFTKKLALDTKTRNDGLFSLWIKFSDDVSF